MTCFPIVNRCRWIPITKSLCNKLSYIKPERIRIGTIYIRSFPFLYSNCSISTRFEIVLYCAIRYALNNCDGIVFQALCRITVCGRRPRLRCAINRGGISESCCTYRKRTPPPRGRGSRQKLKLYLSFFSSLPT